MCNVQEQCTVTSSVRECSANRGAIEAGMHRLIGGENLKNLIERIGPASDVNAVMDCMKELARVVHRCHQEGVIHRDIKPATIVFRAGDVARAVLANATIWNTGSHFGAVGQRSASTLKASTAVSS